MLTAHLDHYLRLVRPTLPTSTLLFTNPHGQQAGQPLTGRALLELCRRLGATTSIAGPHTALRWRHTYASLSLARGVDLYVLSRLLGRARVETTQRYLHLDTGQLTDAIRRAYPHPAGPPTTDRPPHTTKKHCPTSRCQPHPAMNFPAARVTAALLLTAGEDLHQRDPARAFESSRDDPCPSATVGFDASRLGLASTRLRDRIG